MEYSALMDTLCRQKGVSCKQVAIGEYAALIKKIKAPTYNGDVITLDKAPKIAVYTPSGKKPWDDAVTLALTYAEIPFDKLYVDEVLAGKLGNYDWLHLHHEDFTGQFSKFWATFKDYEWYRADCLASQKMAKKQGFKKVSQMQLAVAKNIKEFVAGGGNLFAMCSATDSYDIALAAAGTDICDTPYDGDKMDPNAQAKLNFDNCLAFTGFTIATEANGYRFSSIDNTIAHSAEEQPVADFFTLRSFPAKFDPVPSMLCQNHAQKIKGFLGIATTYKDEHLRPDVLIMGEYKELSDAKYIHGTYGAGAWTFYGGHDPEDYRHSVGDAPTDLANHPNSPGYRLILNNVLCLASGKEDIAPIICCDSPGVAMKKTEFDVPAALSKSNVKISPGTVSNSIIIAVIVLLGNSNPISKIERVTFVNSSGKEVLDRQYSTTKVNVDIDGLPNGMYSIKVNGEYVGKVVKN
jgi:hypothetical protein